MREQEVIGLVTGNDSAPENLPEERVINSRELIELAEPRERAILVGAPLKAQAAEVTEEHLQELERLADTAEAEFRQRFGRSPRCIIMSE